MKDGYAVAKVALKPCGSGVLSFYNLVEEVTSKKREKYGFNLPLHRFCCLMRKMGARSYLPEQLELNEELREEQQEATRRCKGKSVKLEATRLTFFCSLP